MLLLLIFAVGVGTRAKAQAPGDMFWYRHTGRSRGTANFANNGTGLKIGNSWNWYTHVFAANDGVIYGVTPAGDLYWYRHQGRSDGTAVFANGGSRIKIGSGFGVFEKLFAADDGVLYGITPTGDLYWYQHQGRSDGTAVFANSGTGIKVGSGFNGFNKVFAAEDGVLYGITPTGDLYWYQHQGRSDGTVVFANSGTGIKVGSGWNSYTQVFAADDGVVYGTTSSGDLYWYQHLGRSDGTWVWANNGFGIKVGWGWTYSQIFAANDSVIYGIE
jgi:hypothetical protein